MAERPKGCTTIQRNLSKMKKWGKRNLTKKGKCQVMYQQRSKSTDQEMLEDHYLQNSFAKKNVVVLVNGKLTMRQECTMMAKKGNSILGNNRKSIASRLRRMSHSLCSALRNVTSSGLFSRKGLWTC